jgi:hypothetical protein
VAATSSVFTIGRVAEILGEDEDWLDEIAVEMDPEDGRLVVPGSTGSISCGYAIPLLIGPPGPARTR